MLIQTQPASDFTSGMSLKLTPQTFFEAYCWVAFSRAIGESKLIEIWPDLIKVYVDFNPYGVDQYTAPNAQEWMPSEVALGPSQCALMIQLFGWKQFKQQFISTSDPQQSLVTLRGLDWLSVQQLGRLLDMEWAN
ncbi:MAG: hypothetical protein WCA07_03745 [Gloeobacterales cyanobacterium]